MRKKYFLHLLRSLPLLPIIYFQGKKIKKEIPLLPAAKNPEGSVIINSNRSLKVLFIGESSFAGVGTDYHKNSFAGHFAEKISDLFQSNINWKVYAKIGYNINQIQRIIIPKIEEKNCNLIVVGIGGNDTFELTQPKKWSRSIQILIDDLRGKFPDTPILFAQLPTIEAFPAFTAEMKFVLAGHKNILANYLHQQVLKNKNIFYPSEKINIQKWMATLKDSETVSDFFSDGIHPSELTYKMWAYECADFLHQSSFKFN